MVETDKRTDVDGLADKAQYPDPLNSFILNAMYEDATDIHINVVDGGAMVLFRVDGILHEKCSLSREMGRKLLNQIKVAADQKISRSFTSHEGQMRWYDESRGDTSIRVTIVPMGGQECAHLRILTMSKTGLDMVNLGFSDEHMKCVSESLGSLSGLILVTGITGSGKTTTMYSMASSTDLRSLAAFSIEDPVEFVLPNSRQLEVDNDHGLTMHQGLRTILRMDPDLIMVGEIRDRDSAVVAARAAMSGRLVLATIHGRDTVASVDALHYMGVPCYIISSSLRLIVAQRLIRRLCPDCASPRTPCAEEQEIFEKTRIDVPDKIFDPVGCDHCNGYGYKGRIGMFEIAAISPNTTHKIATGVHSEKLRQHFSENGVTPLAIDGLKKVACGITSMHELFERCDFRELLIEARPQVAEAMMI